MIIENPLSRKQQKMLGNVSYYVRYGKYILRTKPLFVRDAKTPAQLAHRMRIKKLALLIRQVLDCINTAYAGSVKGKGRNAFNYVESINIRKCFVGDDQSIDPGLLVLCDNEGSFVGNVVLTSTVANTITGTFDSNVQNADEGNDPVRAYGFYPEDNKIWQFDQSDIRKTGTITLTQPDMSGLQIAVYFECLDRVNLLNDKPKHVIKYVGTINVN